jgi:hypothetical protein
MNQFPLPFPGLFLAAALGAAVLPPLCALGGREPDRPPEEEEAPPESAPTPEELLTVRGRIRLLGNEPFPEPVLTDDEGGDWYLDGDVREQVKPWQRRELTLRGRPEYREIKLANGMSLGVRRFLRDAVIVP